MKETCLFLLLGAVLTSGRAQWAVIDVPNLRQSVANYALMGEQLAKQATQIANQVQQIQQFELQLKRLGDMATIKELVGFPEFHLDLKLPSKVRAWADGVKRVDGRKLFGDTRGGIYIAVNAEFPDFDGQPVERQPEIYRRAQDIAVAVDEFQTVQADVYTRREELKSAIRYTADALRTAETEAEEQKLAGVLNAQYGQLAAVDAEIGMSAAQVQVKAAESAAMENAQFDGESEARGHLAQQEARRLTTTFTPQYECLLQYVSERRFTP